MQAGLPDSASLWQAGARGIFKYFDERNPPKHYPTSPSADGFEEYLQTHFRQRRICLWHDIHPTQRGWLLGLRFGKGGSAESGKQNQLTLRTAIFRALLKTPGGRGVK